MAGKQGIPDAVCVKIKASVVQFNEDVVKKPQRSFSVRIRGKYVYIDRDDYGIVGPRARLTYTGDLEQWEFAIYKYSDERYDPNEWMFPGAEHLDGTIEGALRAAMGVYP